MNNKRDYYDTLGVDRNASASDIKKAFRKLAFDHHPDRNQHDGAEEKFKEISEAYEVLGDPEKRATYDRFGHIGAQGFGGRGFEGFDFGGLGDIFDTFFGGATGTRRTGPRRGGDLSYGMAVSFEDAVFGCEKHLEIVRTERCSVCGGTRSEPGSKPETCTTCEGMGQVRRAQRSIFGQFINMTTCGQCNGEGKIVTRPCKSCGGQGRERVTRKIEIRVPAGVDDGMQIRLSGEGDAGRNGGSPGNLYVTLSVKGHKLFRRDASDILYELPINFAQAALGDDIDVPTLEGDFPLKIPVGCQSGRVFRIKDKGVPHLRGRGRGDQLVRVHVITPQTLDAKQKKLFKELAQTLDGAKLPTDDKSFFDRMKDTFGGA